MSDKEDLVANITDRLRKIEDLNKASCLISGVVQHELGCLHDDLTKGLALIGMRPTDRPGAYGLPKEKPGGNPNPGPNTDVSN